MEHWQSGTWASLPSAVEAVPAIVRQVLLCPHVEYEDALAIIDSALNRRSLTLATLRNIVATLPPRFARVLRDVDARSESGLESLCRFRLRELGLQVRSQVWFEEIGRVDLVVADRIILETDGREFHEASFLGDRTRDLALVSRGHIVIRVAYHHVVHEWNLVEQAVQALVRRGEHRWSAAHRREGLV
ncbi:DUF559 domain-containing protein [Antiquaquibacter oligotrophicus]|uniref:DUF559 domain-containing protein n=1 Tax=Antiquaquibacter oligotrophicus TaxID=2880260 RepID=UPI002AC8CECF|nr:DUF559 domain-containing protein [Antiquaquibacter oligotrophicus]UDF14719.1 DUF559 domain-containing protein [Antiquaquibacter oligotrophicus]